jgi:hypothetical protein
MTLFFASVLLKIVSSVKVQIFEVMFTNRILLSLGRGSPDQ